VSLADAVILASMSDLITFIIKHNENDKELIRRCIMNVRRVNPNIIGAVLNNVDLGRSHYKDYYYVGYYYYGEEPTRRRNAAPEGPRRDRGTAGSGRRQPDRSCNRRGSRRCRRTTRATGTPQSMSTVASGRLWALSERSQAAEDVGRHGRLAPHARGEMAPHPRSARWHRRDVRGCVGVRPRLRRHGRRGPIEPGALSASGIVAFELLAERLAAARRTNPGLIPVAGDAARLPLKVDRSGLSTSATMISSVLDPDYGARYSPRSGAC